MSKKYLVHLRDYSGDDCYFVVGEATLNWFDSPRPEAFNKGKTSFNEKIPADVLAEATETPQNKTVCVTSGSCENDRAIQAMELFTVLAFKPRGKFTDIWEGMIY